MKLNEPSLGKDSNPDGMEPLQQSVKKLQGLVQKFTTVRAGGDMRERSPDHHVDSGSLSRSVLPTHSPSLTQHRVINRGATLGCVPGGSAQLGMASAASGVP